MKVPSRRARKAKKLSRAVVTPFTALSTAVVRGSCWAGIPDGPMVQLHAGDVVMFPHGDAHVVSSAPGLRGSLDMDWFAGVREQALPLRVAYSGSAISMPPDLQPFDPADTAIVCGFLGCDLRPFNPLIEALPPHVGDHADHGRPGLIGGRVEPVLEPLADRIVPRPEPACHLLVDHDDLRCVGREVTIFEAEIEHSKHERAHHRLGVLPADRLERAPRVRRENRLMADIAVIARAVAPHALDDLMRPFGADQRRHRAVGALLIPDIHGGAEFLPGVLGAGQRSTHGTQVEIPVIDVALLGLFEVVERPEQRQ